jgi:peptidoglycan/xylan/chitin deacetylase (PgdA/CDA1 family)
VPDVVVLAYHGVSWSWPAITAIRPDDLAAQLHHLDRRGYTGVGFTDAVTGPSRGKRVAVTFDDAHLSVYEQAWPVLAALGWPGTVFVPTDYPGAGRPLDWSGNEQWLGGAYEDELACMSWDQLRELAGAGWEIGSHTCSHPHLTSLGIDDIERELAGSLTALRREMGGCEAVAYPYGDVDDRVAACAKAVGYRTGAGAPRGFERPRDMQWPRVVVDRTHAGARFRLRADPRIRRFLSWPPVARVRDHRRPPRPS